MIDCVSVVFFFSLDFFLQKKYLLFFLACLVVGIITRVETHKPLLTRLITFLDVSALLLAVHSS